MGERARSRAARGQADVTPCAGVVALFRRHTHRAFDTAEPTTEGTRREVEAHDAVAIVRGIQPRAVRPQTADCAETTWARAPLRAAAFAPTRRGIAYARRVAARRTAHGRRRVANLTYPSRECAGRGRVAIDLARVGDVEVAC